MRNKYSQALHALVDAGKRGGLSAKQARRYAQENLTEYLRLETQQRKLFDALQASALDAGNLLPVGGKPTKTVPHMSSKAKQASNACLVDTYGKHRNVVKYAGQKTSCPKVISRKPDTDACKERARNRAWDKKTIARLDARQDKQDACKEHAKNETIKKEWGMLRKSKKQTYIID